MSLVIVRTIASATDEVPVQFDRRKARGLGLKHVSWWRILTLAIEEQERRGVDDPEQAYILGELIRHLQDDRSGASSARKGAAQANPEALLYQLDPKREACAFRLHRDSPMGRKAGKDKGSLAGESRAQMHAFYRDVLHNTRAWQPPAPRLPKEPEPTATGADAVPSPPRDPELVS